MIANYKDFMFLKALFSYLSLRVSQILLIILKIGRNLTLINLEKEENFDFSKKAFLTLLQECTLGFSFYFIA